MNAHGWQRLEEVFFAALDLPSGERAAFVAAACGPDEELRREVMAVLAGHERAGGTQDVPLAGAAAGTLVDLVGRQLGPYRIEAPVGRGGMGEVYRAQRVDDQYRQVVAVKLVRSNVAAEEVRRRFRVERQVLARLQHPNVATLLDGGVADDGRPYLVMQYVDGVPITEYVDRRELSLAARLRLFATVCRTVQFAHSNLVVHRDLKPTNILVDDAGQVKLLDFGIAKLLDPAGLGVTAAVTEEHLLLTPDHAAPEQLLGQAITTATDIYALGLLLYELLTRQRPFTPLTGAAWQRAVCEEEPRRPSTAISDRLASSGEESFGSAAPPVRPNELRGDLDDIVMMALRREPTRRYASAEQFAEDIERYLDGRPVLARPDTLSYRARKFARRNRLATAAALALLVVLVGATTVTMLQARDRAAALAVAEAERDRANAMLQHVLAENTRAGRLTGMVMGLFERGGFRTAAESLAAQHLLARGLARVEERTVEPAARALTLTMLGRVHRHIGDYPTAAALLERSIALQLALGDDKQTDISEARIALADVYMLTGNLNESETLLREVLSTDSVRYGGDHPRLAWALEQLAATLLQRGDYVQTEPVLQQVLGMRKRLWDGDNIGTASTLIDLGLLYRRTGRWRSAESHIREGLAMRQRMLTRVSWPIAEALTQLGALLVELERPAEAAPFLREAQDIYRTLYGERHPSLTAVDYNLGRALSELGRDEEAERLLEGTIEDRRELFGPRTNRVATALRALATHQLQRERLGEAEQNFREALAIFRAGQSPHPDEALALAGLGAVARRLGDIDSAAVLLEDALARQTRQLGRHHPWTAATLMELSGVLHARGELDMAERLVREAVQVWHEVLPMDAPSRLAADSMLAALQAQRSHLAATGRSARRATVRADVAP